MARVGWALDGHLIAAPNDGDAEAALDLGEVLVELPVEIADEPVVVKREDQVSKVGGGAKLLADEAGAGLGRLWRLRGLRLPLGFGLVGVWRLGRLVVQR